MGGAEAVTTVAVKMGRSFDRLRVNLAKSEGSNGKLLLLFLYEKSHVERGGEGVLGKTFLCRENRDGCKSIMD